MILPTSHAYEFNKKFQNYLHCYVLTFNLRLVQEILYKSYQFRLQWFRWRPDKDLSIVAASVQLLQQYVRDQVKWNIVKCYQHSLFIFTHRSCVYKQRHLILWTKAATIHMLVVSSKCHKCSSRPHIKCLKKKKCQRIMTRIQLDLLPATQEAQKNYAWWYLLWQQSYMEQKWGMNHE